jgi:hypothetical protein
MSPISTFISWGNSSRRNDRRCRWARHADDPGVASRSPRDVHVDGYRPRRLNLNRGPNLSDRGAETKHNVYSDQYAGEDGKVLTFHFILEEDQKTKGP